MSNKIDVEDASTIFGFAPKKLQNWLASQGKDTDQVSLSDCTEALAIRATSRAHRELGVDQ